MYNEDEVLDHDEPPILLYVEKSSRHIYQVQILDSFILLRIVGFPTVVKKIGTTEFLETFEEYNGNYDDLYHFTDMTISVERR